jgi:inner membrane transporter RhtA
LKTFQAVIPICATILAMAAFQSGASVAKGLFPAVGAQGAASLRLLIGATILVLITRPWTAWPPRAARASILLLGVCMAAAVLAFYLALERLPQGVCIAIQFLGPLAVAIGGSRRMRDLLWAALAAIGVACLLSVGRLGVADPLGIAAVGWGGYIVVGRRVSSIGGGPGTAALAMSVAAAIMLPIGLERAGPALFAPSHLALALLVGALAAAIPFPLELFALSRLPARTFAVLMSLEPAFGALSGFVLLGQHLRATQVMGVAAVVIAAIGATLTSAAPAIPSPGEGEIV